MSRYNIYHEIHSHRLKLEILAANTTLSDNLFPVHCRHQPKCPPPPRTAEIFPQFSDDLFSHHFQQVYLYGPLYLAPSGVTHLYADI